MTTFEDYYLEGWMMGPSNTKQNKTNTIVVQYVCQELNPQLKMNAVPFHSEDYTEVPL